MEKLLGPLGVLMLASACAQQPDEAAKPPTPPVASQTVEAAASTPSAASDSAPAPTAEIAALVNAIDEDPDPLHNDYTPAVHALTTHGIPAAAAVVHLLDAHEPMTRRRAQRVIEGVVLRAHGWKAGQGFERANSDASAKVDAIFAANGAYDAAASASARRASLAKWRKWLAEQH